MKSMYDVFIEEKNYIAKYGYNRNIKKVRKLIRERDNYICQICGKINSKDVHHIDGNKINDSPYNLITLCRSCHLKRPIVFNEKHEFYNENAWIIFFHIKVALIMKQLTFEEREGLYVI